MKQRELVKKLKKLGYVFERMISTPREIKRFPSLGTQKSTKDWQ